MPGLVPGIFFAAQKRIAGTSPAMMGARGLWRLDHLHRLQQHEDALLAEVVGEAVAVGGPPVAILRLGQNLEDHHIVGVHFAAMTLQPARRRLEMRGNAPEAARQFRLHVAEHVGGKGLTAVVPQGEVEARQSH